MAEKDWLDDGLCNYDGPEADLPLGGHSRVPGWYPEKAAKVWIVADPESEEGVIEKKTKDLKKDDIIIGVVMNVKTLEAIAKTYGPNFYLIKKANAGKWLTPAEWAAEFPNNPNGLGLVAIRNMRRKLQGSGITIK